MNKFFRCTAAGISAAVLTVSYAASFVTVMAEDSAETDPDVMTKITLVLEEGEVYTPPKGSDKTEVVYEDIDTSQTNIFYMPEGTVKKGESLFFGWTIDGVRGYRSNAPVVFDTSIREIKIRPIVVDIDYDERVTISHDLGKDIDLPKDFPESYTARIGSCVSPYAFKINDGNTYTSKYSFEGNIYSGEDYLIVPDHDVVFEAVWKHVINLTFSAGDVDRLTGGDTFVTIGNEGTSTELSASDRFGRIGYNLVGWKSDYDGKTYLPGVTVSNLPGVDITYTAVWEPKKYTVVFNQGTGKVADNLKVPGFTDTSIVCPEPTILKDGKYFAGWKNASSGEIYQPGDEYFIYGVAPGLGIAFTPVWSDTPIVKELIPGDADLSGGISVSDIVTILQYSANKGKYPLGSDALKCADVNGDSDVNATDAYIVQQLDAGEITLDDLKK